MAMNCLETEPMLKLLAEVIAACESRSARIRDPCQTTTPRSATAAEHPGASSRPTS
jgi:hypothetical protein